MSVVERVIWGWRVRIRWIFIYCCSSCAKALAVRQAKHSSEPLNVWLT